MEVILKQDVKSLGYKDDIIKVRDGYGRNFLIPRGYAVLATDSNRKMLAEEIKQVQFKQDRIKQDAMKMAEGLKELNITIGAKVSETGKIFGSVTPLQFAEAIKRFGFELDRRKITFESDIKAVGKYMANLNLHREVKIQVEFEVVAE